MYVDQEDSIISDRTYRKTTIKKTKKGKQMKKIVTSLFAVVCLAVLHAEAPKFQVPVNKNPGKVCLLVADVGTIDTVAKTEEFLTKIKQFNVASTPKVSDADKATNPRLAKAETNFRFFSNIKQYNEEQREIARQNRRMEAILERLRTAIIGDKNKRDIVVAKNYLHSFLSPYGDFIKVIDRANTSLAEVEKAISGNDQQDIASACVFLTVIMQDLNAESSTVSVANTLIKKTTYTQKAVGNIRDFNGNVLTAFHVVGKTSRRQTSASKSEGYNPASDLMENVLKQIAEKVAAYYVAKLEFKCVGPKGDENFDDDTAVFTVDGKDFENGDQICAGKHVITAEVEGYKTIRKNIFVRNNHRKTVIKLKFKKKLKCPDSVIRPPSPQRNKNTKKDKK